MEPSKGSFRDLKVWQKACSLAKMIYHLTWQFPKHEVYGLAQQMQRAVVSVPANIAEGCARKGSGEFIQFLYIAAGSLAEVETFVELARQLDYGEPSLYEPITLEAEEVGKMLYGLIARVRAGSRPPH